MLVQTMYRLILLTDGSGVLSTTAPGAFGTGFADGGVVAGFGCDDGAAGRTSVESAGGVALGHKSRLTVLSTMRTSVDRNLGSK